jgi:Polyketide cyclase / dehydrase and lipid transport
MVANRIDRASARAGRLGSMSKVQAIASAQLAADPDQVLGFLRDYHDKRRRILTDNYTAYRVEQGGTGDGTIYAYHFAAGGRERDYRLHVHEHDRRLEESDQMSSFRSVWSVDPAPGGSRVTIESSWDGAGGIAGVFEGFFAPRGLRRIYAQVLDRLRDQLR